MGNELTEGQRLYLEEEYEQALDKLKTELQLAGGLSDLGVDPEFEYAQLHKYLIDSIEGELPVEIEGQAGILEIVGRRIDQGKLSGVELAFLSLFENSSNEGIQYITSLLRDVADGRKPTQDAISLEYYKKATKNVDGDGEFFFFFGRFLLNLGRNSLRGKETFEEAIKLFDAARSEGLDTATSNYVASLMSQGVAHVKLGELGVRSRENFEDAIELFEAARDEGLEASTIGYANSLFNQGNAHRDLGEIGVHPRENFKNAIEMYKDARNKGFEAGTNSYALSLIYQGVASLELGEMGVNPRENLEDAIELPKTARDEGLEAGTRDYALSLMEQGNAHGSLAGLGVRPRENLEDAIELHETARDEGFEAGTVDYAGSLISQGLAQTNLGEIGVRPKENFEEAIELHETARDEGLEEGTLGYGKSLVNQGRAHRNLGEMGVQPKENFENAIKLYETARDNGLKTDTRDYARSIVYQGNARASLGDLGEEPRKNYEDAIKLYETARDEGLKAGTRDYARSLTCQGTTHATLGKIGEDPKKNYEEAIELHETARDEGLEGGTTDYATSLVNQGNVHRFLAQMGVRPKENFAEAEALYTEARQIYDAMRNHDGLRRVEKNFAGLYMTRGKDAKAYRSYKKAIESVEEIRSTVRFRDHREEFFEEHVPIYYRMVLLALDMNKNKAAFEYAERAKGRIFLEMLENVRVESDITKQLAEQEQRLKEEITTLRELLRLNGSDREIVDSSFGELAENAPLRSGSDTPRQSPATAMNEEVDQSDEAHTPQRSVASRTTEELIELLNTKKAQHSEILEKIREKDPEAYALKTVDVASLDQVQEALASNEQVLEYLLTGDELLIFLISEDKLKYKRVSMDVAIEFDSLPEAVAEYRELVEPPGKGDVSRMQELGQDLYRVLIDPVKEQLGDKHLLIVPHGPLHVLPFSALYNGENYLIENHHMRFLANASSLRFLDENDGSHNDEVLVVGDPRGDLEHAREEAREVAALHDEEVLIGDEATKAEIQQRIETAKISHLCCHGQYDPDSPIHSSLLFADEEMYLEDVLNLNVGSELVTLSACQTAYGEISQGDEVTSLTRAFQYAGSPSVIGTLWRIDDESTRRFFRCFYEGDGDRTERLRQTQLTFIRENNEQSHPFYWSAFQMYGIG